jgi:hypothetical protein
MRANSNKSGNGLNRLLAGLAAQKKKSIIAAALVALMVFMWIRLLAGKGTQSAAASAEPAVSSSNTRSQNSGSKVVFVALPVVKGRHDVLARDFFRLDAQAFGGGGQASIVSDDGGNGSAQKLAQLLRLEAICMGPQRQAFINDKLVTAGETLEVIDGSKSYECEVVSIEENSVFVKCGTIELELKLKSALGETSPLGGQANQTAD